MAFIAKNDGHSLLDELNVTLDTIDARAADRAQVVKARLQELEKEQLALDTVKLTINGVRAGS